MRDSLRRRFPGRLTFPARAPPCVGWRRSTRTGGRGLPDSPPIPQNLWPRGGYWTLEKRAHDLPDMDATWRRFAPRAGRRRRRMRGGGGGACGARAARISARGFRAPARRCPARRCARSGARPTWRTAARRWCTATSRRPTSCSAASPEDREGRREDAESQRGAVLAPRDGRNRRADGDRLAVDRPGGRGARPGVLPDHQPVHGRARARRRPGERLPREARQRPERAKRAGRAAAAEYDDARLRRDLAVHYADYARYLAGDVWKTLTPENMRRDHGKTNMGAHRRSRSHLLFVATRGAAGLECRRRWGREGRRPRRASAARGRGRAASAPRAGEPAGGGASGRVRRAGGRRGRHRTCRGGGRAHGRCQGQERGRGGREGRGGRAGRRRLPYRREEARETDSRHSKEKRRRA